MITAPHTSSHRRLMQITALHHDHHSLYFRAKRQKFDSNPKSELQLTSFNDQTTVNPFACKFFKASRSSCTRVAFITLCTLAHCVGNSTVLSTTCNFCTWSISSHPCSGRVGAFRHTSISALGLVLYSGWSWRQHSNSLKPGDI